MSNLFSNTDLSLSYEASNSLPLSKSIPFSIDLLDLVSSNPPYTPSSLSTYDSISVKAEEESLKPSTNEDTLTVKDAEELVAVELVNPRKLTLGDIVSKRPYTRRPKGIDNTIEKVVEKRQKPIKLQNDPEEIQIKKEKLDNRVVKNVLIKNEEKESFPEIVFKDGRVQLTSPVPLKEDGIKQELQVIESSQKKMTTSASFTQNVRAEKWTEVETAKFYRALELFGTEFSMIAKVFKNRNRTQIKNKFLREEKTASEKINAALQGSESISFAILLQKFKRYKETQTLSNNNPNSNNSSFNLMKPLLISDKMQQNIEIGSLSENRDLQVSTNIDSIDMNIMEDLSDIFVSKKEFLNI